MNIVDENRRLWRLLGRCEVELKCRKHGPPLRGRPAPLDRSCRARIPNDRSSWCPVCLLLADIEGLAKS